MNKQDRIRILFVDDEKDIRDSFREIMEVTHIVDTASSKEDAIHKLKLARKEQFSYDVVLLDNYLPGPDDGIEVLEHIRDNNIDVIAIMISSHMSSTDSPFRTGMKAFNAGAIDFLTKPIEYGMIDDRLATLVNKKRQYSTIIQAAISNTGEDYRNLLENIVNDGEADMITRNRAAKLLERDGGQEEAGSFLPGPKDIEINDTPVKSHNSMFDKRLRHVADIPEVPRRLIFDVMASHRNVYRIKFGAFHRAGTQVDYRFKIKTSDFDSGALSCTLFGPSPINCTSQDFIVYVDRGSEEKVKLDLENKLSEYIKR